MPDLQDLDMRYAVLGADGSQGSGISAYCAHLIV
jgi:hypothetical protein